jgi:hypothetical protein
MPTRAFIGLLLIVGGCKPATSPDQKQAIQLRYTASEQPLVLTQTSILPGTTSVDPSTATVLFLSSSMSKRDTIVSLLNRNSTFLSDDGDTLPASAELKSMKMPPDGILVSLTPTSPLKADHWYTLVVNEDSEVQVSNGQSQQALTARGTAVWKSDFFTGSAPHLVRAQMPTGIKDGSYIHVVFSEPVRLSSLIVAPFLSVDGTAMAKCILLNGNCASSLDNVMAEEFDLAPTRPLGSFNTLSFVVSGSTSGSARTVSEGAVLALTRAPATIGRGKVQIDLPSSSWSPCENGASLCWHAHN